MHYCLPAYVDLAPKAAEGKVRFCNAQESHDLLSKLKDGNLLIKDSATVHLELLPTEEEGQYFKSVEAKRERFRREKIKEADAIKQKLKDEENKRLHGKIPRVIPPSFQKKATESKPQVIQPVRLSAILEE